MAQRTVKMRSWVKWTILAVWVLTATAVFVLTQIHVPVRAAISLRTSEISIPVNAAILLNSTEESQLSVSGPTQFSLATAGRQHSQIIRVDAPTSASSCTFYQVEADSLTLVDLPPNQAGEARVTLSWPRNADGNSFVARMPQHLAGNLVLVHGPFDHSSFTCSGVSPSDQDLLSGNLSENGGSSFRTRGTSQIVLHQAYTNSHESTNLHVSGRIWVGHIDPLNKGYATATLLAPLPGRKNQVTFEGVSKQVQFEQTDLVEIDPGSHFDIRSIAANKGIQIELHGTIKNLRAGAGLNDLTVRMPSAFDLLDAHKRVLGIIPSIATAIIGFLETLGWLPRRKTR